MHRGGYSESDALNDGIETEEIILDQLPEPEQESEEDMATGDKLVNLDDLKVTYDKQQEDTNALKSAIGDITGNQIYNNWVGPKKYIALNDSTADINNPATSFGNCQCMVIPASEGDSFCITATGGIASRAYGFVASATYSTPYAVLGASPASASFSETVVICPANTAYLVVNDATYAGKIYKNELVKNDIKNINNTVNEIQNIKARKFTNLFNYFGENTVITGGYFDASNGNWISDSLYGTAVVPVLPNRIYAVSNLQSTTIIQVTFWNENDEFIIGKISFPDGYILTPDNCYFIKIPSTSIGTLSVTEGKEQPPELLPYNKSKYIFGSCNLEGLNSCASLNTLTPYDISATGVMMKDGTINTSFSSIHILKYSITEEKTYFLNGSGTFDPNNGYCYVWFVKNGSMVNCIVCVRKPQIFENYAIYADGSFDEIWINRETIVLQELTSIDKKARNDISVLQEEISGAIVIGSQWNGKTWYAYGTSITNTSAEGKYATYLAQMSGMTLVNKGISGGGIGDLGGYSHGQVYDAICNITDGKLNADLISLETGANDTGASVPLGTIYDEGRTTLAGCLNDCLRYLQANTNAQIVVTCSPATKSKPVASSKYYEWAQMVEQICHINRVHFLNADNNMGYAKISDSTKGSLYVVDNIHQTNLGGYIMAQNLWYQLRNIPLFYTAIPT